jgi:hypothetical protein
MNISGKGAAVGALVGAAARAAVVLLNLARAGPSGRFAVIALPSAGIGVLVGAIAGATGRPLRGALLGAAISGGVFFLFIFTCVSLIGEAGLKPGSPFGPDVMLIALEMAAAGAVAGAVGGAVGQAGQGRRDAPVGTAPEPRE